MSGTVEAQNQVAIYPEIDAPVEAVIAQNGDDVEEGDPLVRLRDDQYQERVRQAEASLRIARADAKSARADLTELRSQLNRTERLADQEFESQQQLESLRAQVEQAEAQVERAEAQVQQAQATLGERKADLRRTVVRAPITGRVGDRNVQGGQRVDPNTQLYTMGNLGSVRITVPVSDRMMGRIEEGQTARITAPSLDDTTIVADVSRVSPFVSSGSYSAEAEIDVANPDGLLRAGMFVQVDVAYAESQRAPLVPLSALYEDPTTGRRGLFVAPTLGTEVPVTHHITLPASTAALAVLPWGVVPAMLVGTVFGITGALSGEVLQRLFYAHGDTHVDPPAFAIALNTFVIALLAILGIFPGASWVATLGV